jgi:hypothetical protein
MQKVVLGMLAGLFGSLTLLATATPSYAIPAFARKYDLPCSFCHSAFPKLNDVGVAFRDNGYRLGNDRDNPVNQPGAYFPLAFRTPVGYQYTLQTHQATLEDPDQTIRSGSFQDFGLDILSVGTLAEKISYNLVFVLSDQSTIGLESAWIRFDELADSSWLNLKAGIFEMDVPFSTKRILTLSAGYPIYDYRPSGSVGEMSLSENQAGMELAGHSADGVMRYAIEMIEGDNTELGKKEPFSPDFFAHATYRIRGHRVGAFGYYGQEATEFLHETSGDLIEGTGKNPKAFYRYGVDLTLRVGILDLLVLGMQGIEPKEAIDTDSTTTAIEASAQDGTFYGGFLEANLHVSPRLVLIARYDLVRNSQQPDPTVAKSTGDIDQVTAAVRQALNISTRSDVFLHAEVSAQRTNQGVSTEVREIRSLLAFDFAF